jgi:hypothetical protein
MLLKEFLLLYMTGYGNAWGLKIASMMSLSASRLVVARLC